MNNVYRMVPQRYRAIWISDVHLGTRGCKADFLRDFLKSTESEYLYLVGDIIDLWALRRGVYWPQAHNDVLRTILGKAKRGTKVVYVPGNHDEPFREYDGMVFGSVEVKCRVTHTTAAGKKFLILHGDEFDSVIRYSKLLAYLGDHAYTFLLKLNRYVNYVRRLFGRPYWSLSSYLKQKVKNAVNVISDFEDAIAKEARRHGVDGLVCGHIHHAEIEHIKGVLYCNDGDWVESCTALVEHHDGTLHLLHWADQRHTLKSSHASGAVATEKIA